MRHRCGVGVVDEGREAVLVVLNGGAELETRSFTQEVVEQRGPEALLAEDLETRPRNGALVAFQHVEPMLGSPNKMERGEPDFIRLECALTVEELLAAVQPTDGIILVSKRGEG